MPIRKRPNGSWFVDVSDNRQRRRLTFPAITPRSVLKEAELKLMMELRIRPKLGPPNILVLQQRAGGGKITDELVVRLLASVRAGAKKRGYPSDLDEAGVRMLLERANGRCELTGVPLMPGTVDGHRRNPYAPSVDRVDCRAGYSRKNCRIVAFAVNVAVNEWGDAVFHEIASSYASRLGAA